MVELIERGAGYCVLPRSGLIRSGARITLAPLRGISVTWTLAVSRRREKVPAVRALVAMIRSQAAALIKEGVWRKAA
jgi:LysR family transcriptional regulator, nitrogen assimilation regulatory protein